MMSRAWAFCLCHLALEHLWGPFALPYILTSPSQICIFCHLARGLCLFPTISSFCGAQHPLETLMLALYWFLYVSACGGVFFPAFTAAEDSTLFSPLIIAGC